MSLIYISVFVQTKHLSSNDRVSIPMCILYHYPISFAYNHYSISFAYNHYSIPLALINYIIADLQNIQK